MFSPRVALFLIFVAFPLLELAVLIKLGEVLGFWPTIGLLFVAAVLGFAIIRDQGVSMVGRMFANLQEGQFPLESVVDSYVLIIAGFLLIAPGVISDAIGLLLLIPPLRRWGIRRALADLVPPSSVSERARPAKSERPIVIEGTYERVEEDESAKKPKGDL
jgi:UPF0716 protein FxsA